MMAKKWLLVKKNHDGVGHGVYVRDIPTVVANAAVEIVSEWWDEHEDNVWCFMIGMMTTIMFVLFWG